MYFFVRKSPARATVVRIHPAHPARQHGRAGASVIVPMLGTQGQSELRDNIDIMNGMNPDRAKITQEQVEKAVEKKMKREEVPSTAALIAKGLKPGERRTIKPK